jgi:hypothetical protein
LRTAGAIALSTAPAVMGAQRPAANPRRPAFATRPIRAGAPLSVGGILFDPAAFGTPTHQPSCRRPSANTQPRPLASRMSFQMR